MPTTINGDGVVTAGGTASTQGKVVLAEQTGNGTNTVTLQAPASLAADLTLTMPSADGTNGQVLQTNGSGVLSFGNLASPLAVDGNATAGAEIRLPEDTDNGSNYVALKAPNALAANLTLTLPTADGTSNQFLQTNGAGQLSFASVTTPGAIEQFSLVTGGSHNMQAASATSIATGTFYSTTPVITNNTGGVATQGAVFWSKYYSCWFMVGIGAGGTTTAIYSSTDGINWSTYISDLTPKIGSVGVGYATSAGTSPLVVDDSNGRMWVFRWDGSTSILGYYRDPSLRRDASWTSAGAVVSLTSSNGRFHSALYIDTGNTATSAIAMSCAIDSANISLYTCDAGGTTFTQRVTGSSSYSEATNISAVVDAVSKRALFLYANQDRAVYMSTDDARTGWAFNSSWAGGTAPNTGTAGVGGGYYVAAVGVNLRYSSTGASTWTQISAPFGASISASRVMYVKDTWYAVTNNGMYKTTQNPPTTGWAAIAGSPTTIATPVIRTQA